jgi:formamidopyrimidine-DNA glycosylase
MPELPEVETVVRQLRPSLEGRSVSAVHEEFPGVFVRADGAEPRWPVRIEAVRRRAKLILLDLCGGWHLSVHLRMTGRLEVVGTGVGLEPHTHVRIALDGAEELRFVDPRRFGRVRLETTASLEGAGFYSRLGPEPLEVEAADLAARIGGSRASIKAALLDQQRIAGIGNIYADEILFDCGLSPRQPANTILPREWEPLLDSIRSILDSAIGHGGSTIRDYRSADGTAGAYQSAHRVFGRQGEPCTHCRQPIRKIRLAGRGTHFCPRCQPLRRRRPRPITTRARTFR